MVKKGHPPPGFEPTPLEGSKKSDEFLSDDKTTEPERQIHTFNYNQ